MIENILKKACFYRYEANYSKMNEELTKYLILSCPSSDNYKKAFYLKLEALRFMKKFDDARLLLDEIPFKDNSFEYFWAIRRSVDTLEAFTWFESKLFNHLKDFNQKGNVLFNYGVLNRDFGNLDISYFYFRERLLWCFETISFYKNTKKNSKPKWDEKTAIALLDLRSILSKNNIEFFLDCGTLLGAVRDKKLLEYDDDIDIGVLGNNNFLKLKSIIPSSGFFHELENKTPNTYYGVKHKNGVKIDFSLHYKNGNFFFRDGVNCIWENTPFNLKEISFLNKKFFIPKDYNLYLKENYGDWEKKNLEYDVYIDSKNIKIINEDFYILQLLSSIYESYVNGKENLFKRGVDIYLSKRKDREISNFCKKILDKS